MGLTREDVEYSLYLVTDSTPAILKGGHLPTVVKDAIEGGVTIVQYRDKSSDTGDLIRTAKELHEVTRAHNVPLLINDRVDVALAVGCEGVHIGQDDMDIATARRILGDKAIIGVTASSVTEALEAAKAGADYLGLGTVFATPTKENAKSIQGCSGVRSMLAALGEAGYTDTVKTVCIGGINGSNVQRVLYQTTAQSKMLDGVAVVSAIVSSQDPKETAAELRKLIATPPKFARELALRPRETLDLAKVLNEIPDIVCTLAEKTPLCHNMTNLVVQNIAANVALCVGASPIMSNNGLEGPDLAKLGGAFVVNMGTVTPEGLTNYQQALTAYNAAGGPVVFDPVGAGATQQRKNAVKTLLNAGFFDVIKGNEGEIKTVAGTAAAGEQQRGVDSGPSSLSMQQKAALVRDVAVRERNVVLMTGATDLISDGHTTLAVSNGHEYLGEITGSGCCLGTTIASYLAVHREQPLIAALAGLLHYEIAAERAAARSDVKGPGTFVPAFLDELHAYRKEAEKGQMKSLSSLAKVELVNL